jgi:hypothetical protein
MGTEPTGRSQARERGGRQREAAGWRAGLHMREGRESSGIVGIARSGIPCRMHLLNTSDTQRHAHQRWRLPGLAAATTAAQARAAIAGLEQLAQQRVGRSADVRAE